MKIEVSHDIYRRLVATRVDGIDFLDGVALARALRSPRQELASKLIAEGVLSSHLSNPLVELWGVMARIQPRLAAGSLTFDNIYDLILWVYVQIPSYESSSDQTRSCKLFFRGQGESAWKLETTAHRGLKTPEDRARNREQTRSFIRAIQVNFPKRLLRSDLEKEAVAQHYGFATTLLDFTIDVDIAAFFATKGAAKGKVGTIFMSDSGTLLRDGRTRLVRIPEVFARPNLQRGLFVKLPEVREAQSQEDLLQLFVRLDFFQYELEQFNTLYLSVGDILPPDEVAELAEGIKAGRNFGGGVPLADRMVGLEVIEDSAHPEGRAYGRRICDYAGIVTNDAKVFVLTDLLRELVRSGPTGVEEFVLYVRILLAVAIQMTDGRWYRPFAELAIILAALYEFAWGKQGFTDNVRKALSPQSVLVLDEPDAEREQRAEVIALQLRSLIGKSVETLVRSDWAHISKDEVPRLIESIELVDKMEEKLLILNLDRLLDLVAEDIGCGLIARVCSLKAGVVATARPLSFGFLLAKHFDLVISGKIDAKNHAPWSTRRWKEAIDQAERTSRIKPLVIREIAVISLSLDRTLKLIWIRSRRNFDSGQEYLRLSCDSYSEVDGAGKPIAIGLGAATKVIAGPLTGADYKHIASVLMDEKLVGSSFAAAVAEYVSCLRTGADRHGNSLQTLHGLLEYPAGEIALLALQFLATGEVRQPFETP